jgi:hypothetical protein
VRLKVLIMNTSRTSVLRLLVALLVAQIALAQSRPPAQSPGLCAGSGRAVEKTGIGEPLQLAAKQIMPAESDARLTVVTLASFGLCQYTFYSATQNKSFTFADTQGALHELGSGTPKAVPRALPEAFLDLPEAIMAGQQQGLTLPLKSAILRAAGPQGKAAIAIWVLTPANNSSGQAARYFVAASDAGHGLQDSDISDVASEAQARQIIVDPFHSIEAAKNGAGDSTSKRDCLVLHSQRGTQQVMIYSHRPCRFEGAPATP